MSSNEARNFEIRRSSRAKRVSLRVHPKRRYVELVVPKRATMDYALKFAASNQDWIEQNQPCDTQEPTLTEAEVKAYKKQARIELTKLTKEKIDQLNRHPRPDRGSSYRIFNDFFIHLDSCLRGNDVEENNQRWGNIKIRIGDMSTRWGSCHPDGRISYSWRLILASPEARDYVVAHEVAHLIHNDHSPAFWRLCEALSSDYKTGKTWMRDHGKSLHHY